MRKIIDGKAYDTDSAHMVFCLTAGAAADHLLRDEGIWADRLDHSETLYITQGEAFFLHLSYDMTLDDPDEILPQTHEETKEWLTKYANSLVETVFGEQLDAGYDQAIIYLQVPKPLKARIDAAAKLRGQLANAYLVRLLEKHLPQ